MKTFIIEVGRLCKSAQGHDQNRIYAIIKIEKEYVYLCDGKNKKLDNLKLKKNKHIKLLDYVAENVESDEEIARTIKRFKIKGAKS